MFTRSFLLLIAYWLISCPAVWAQQDLSFYLKAAKQNSPLFNENKNLGKATELEAERLKAFYTKVQITATGNLMMAPVFVTDNNQTRLELFPRTADTYYGYDLGASNGGQYLGLITYTNHFLTMSASWRVPNKQKLAGKSI